MRKYPKITFRPTNQMLELVESAKEKTGMCTSEVMRTIMSEYIRFVQKYNKSYR